jgi:hypothetical protein
MDRRSLAMVDIVQLQMLPEEEPTDDMIGCCSRACTCGTGELNSNPFCTTDFTRM